MVKQELAELIGIPLVASVRFTDVEINPNTGQNIFSSTF